MIEKCDKPTDTHCCCSCLEALACAASCIHDQYCCCDDQSGCDCCQKSLGFVLDAMEAHIACLRGVCSTKYAKPPVKKA
jgi:hypothetical protein